MFDTKKVIKERKEKKKEYENLKQALRQVVGRKSYRTRNVSRRGFQTSVCTKNTDKSDDK